MFTGEFQHISVFILNDTVLLLRITATPPQPSEGIERAREVSRRLITSNETSKCLALVLCSGGFGDDRYVFSLPSSVGTTGVD